jgi:capsular polysaccharide biosynthesis protein
MEEKVQIEEGINLLDIVRLLFNKLLILILVGLISGFLGGFVAVARTIDVDYWGTTVEFYVNPEKPKEVVNGSGSQYGVYGAYGRHVRDNIVKLLSSESFAEILIDGTNNGEAIPGASPMKGSPKKMGYNEKEEPYMTGEYKNFLSRVKNAVSFSYLESNADMDDANNLARSFIYVRISVINDREFAKNLLDSVRVIVPWYVEENMTVPTDYSGTNCQKITVMEDIHLTNPGYTTNQAIKYAILFAFAACAVTCVIIILVDRSDKRLRDYELVMRNLEVPVLGVIPTIEPMVQKAKAAAKAAEVKK